MKNYIGTNRWKLVNGLWDDGSIWVSRDGRIVWSVYLPTWLVNTFNRITR